MKYKMIQKDKEIGTINLGFSSEHPAFEKIKKEYNLDELRPIESDETFLGGLNKPHSLKNEVDGLRQEFNKFSNNIHHKNSQLIKRISECEERLNRCEKGLEPKPKKSFWQKITHFFKG